MANTGDVKFAGPLTKEARDRLDHALARRAEAQDNVNYYADQYRTLPDSSPIWGRNPAASCTGLRSS